MAYKNKFFPQNLSKYEGDPTKINCRSLWERKFCKFLDTSKNIIRWSFEPFKIPYISPVDNQLHHYIPDFIIEKKNKDGTIETMLVEIKPEKQTKPPEKGKKSKKNFLNESLTYEINAQKWRSAQDFCKKHNIKFKILTEKEIF
jgi:hypothetical protein